MPYSSNIQILRAISVIAVIFHHYFPNVFVNGYLGVDVFFVISGYLITKQLYHINFDLKIFYFNRAKRILPSVIFLLFVVLIISHLVLLPSELKNTSNLIFASVLFVINIKLYGQVNYFDVAAITKPLCICGV